MTPAHRVAAAVLASVALVPTVVGCTKTLPPPASTPLPTSSPRLVASASAEPGPGDFSDGDN